MARAPHGSSLLLACSQLLARAQTLERSYLLRVNHAVIERPQHMLMRVSVGIHKLDVDRAIQTYNLMSQKCAHAVNASGHMR